MALSGSCCSPCRYDAATVKTRTIISADVVMAVMPTAPVVETAGGGNGLGKRSTGTAH